MKKLQTWGFFIYVWRNLNQIEMEEQKLNNSSQSTLHQTDVMGVPNELEPVLALINHQSDLGKSEWYEIVYFFEEWCSYSGSETFDDGERVVKWKYVKDCL